MAVETPTYPQYTNKALSEGVFDQLMAAVKSHLQQEWDNDRIGGDQWAQVYLGSIEAAMGNSTQFILGMLLIDEKRDQMELQNKQLELQNDVLELQKEELRFKIDYLLPLERDKLQHEINKLAAEITYMQKQGELIDSQIDVNDSTILLHTAQRNKITKEIEFLDAKIKTERANTEGGVAASSSLIGHQQALLRAQKLGFAGDLHVKVAKVYADYDSVYLTVHEVEEATLSNTGSLGAASGVASSISSIP